MSFQKKAWEAGQPQKVDPNAGLVQRRFEDSASVLSADTAEELMEQLEEWLVQPQQPPRSRVSQKLAGGGEPGRWLVIWKTGESDGPYSKEVATKVLQAKRQTSPTSNAWMLNIDRIDLTVFDQFCKAAWVYPWLGKWRYYNCWTDLAGEVRVEGPRNLIEAKAFWLAHREQAKDRQFNMRDPFVLDERGGVILFPRNYGKKPKPRANPEAKRTPAMIRHAVVAVGPRLLEASPDLDDAEMLRLAHAIAWSSAQERGHVRKGTRQLTRAGAEAERRHLREPDATAKDAAYEEMVVAARANPTGLPLSGQATVQVRGGEKRAVVPYRAVVRDAKGGKHRPRAYLDPADPNVAAVIAGHEAMTNVRRIIVHQEPETDTVPLEVVPRRRRGR